MLLAIETSCDETAISLVELNAHGTVDVVSEVVSSQAKLHSIYGGVVPNLAARKHARNLPIVLEEALALAEKKLVISRTQLWERIVGIAITNAPGLAPALLVGISFAETLAWKYAKPLLPVHHLEGHILADLIGSSEKIAFPLLSLVVSGGHTELVLSERLGHYTILGRTEDDAAGEAFDKVARMLGIPYPGGPGVAQAAQNYRQKTSVDAAKKESCRKLFPRPMLSRDNYQFSFSGLKTAVLYYVEKNPPHSDLAKSAICYAFEEAMIDTLVEKTRRAIEQYQPHTVVIAGGVSANVHLRTTLAEVVKKYPFATFRMPAFQYSLDNATMIGAAALVRYQVLGGVPHDTTLALRAHPSLPLSEISF